VDAERLKRNFRYCVRQYSQLEFNEFKTKFPAILEHHFNNHEGCGEWCPVRRNEKEGRETNHLRYRDKVKDVAMYDCLKKILDKYTTDDVLRDIHHNANTNVCEGANFFITKFIPKHKQFCRTIANEARVNLAITILSIGYGETVRRLFEMVGMNVGNSTRKYLDYLDGRREYFKGKWKDDKWRRRRAVAQQRKWREEHQREIDSKKRGLSYSSGMTMGLGEDVRNNVTQCCRKCGGTDHKRSSSRLCPKNARYVGPVVNGRNAVAMLEGTGVPDKARDDMSKQGDMDVDDDDDKGKYERLFVTPPIWRNFTPNLLQIVSDTWSRPLEMVRI
jgi:hypothetical protein